MPKYSPKCRCCEHVNTVGWDDRGSRMKCFCDHPESPECFERSGLDGEKCFIGFTQHGRYKPAITTSPKWCPLRREEE